MRKTALALTALAVATGPLAGVSGASADGCVTTYASHRYQAPKMAWVDAYGRVVVDPNGANGFALAVTYNTVALVDCLV